MTGPAKQPVSVHSHSSLVTVGRWGASLHLLYHTCTHRFKHRSLSVSFLLPPRGSDQQESSLIPRKVSVHTMTELFLRWKIKSWYEKWVTLHCTFISLPATWHWPLGQDRLKPNSKLGNIKTWYFICNTKEMRVNLVLHYRLMFYVRQSLLLLVVWKEPVIPGFYTPHLYFPWENVLVKINALVFI